MMNVDGHVGSLEPSQPGNSNPLRHGVYSPRTLQPRVEEIADAVMAAPHVVPFDRLAAEELGRLQALIEVIDDYLATRPIVNRKGEAHSLLAPRLRASALLQRLCVQFGLTPASRAALGSADSSSGSLAETLAKQRQLREANDDRS